MHTHHKHTCAVSHILFAYTFLIFPENCALICTCFDRCILNNTYSKSMANVCHTLTQTCLSSPVWPHPADALLSMCNCVQPYGDVYTHKHTIHLRARQYHSICIVSVLVCPVFIFMTLVVYRGCCCTLTPYKVYLR